MHWAILLVAIILEVVGTTCLKKSEGFTQVWPAVLMFVFYGFSFAALCFAIQRIPVGVGYAIWSGIGTAMIATIGMTYFKEDVSIAKIICVGLIVAGVSGLKLWENSSESANRDQMPASIHIESGMAIRQNDDA